jgi:putative intracellular protease/amidase/YHS domain-containing protein
MNRREILKRAMACSFVPTISSLVGRFPDRGAGEAASGPDAQKREAAIAPLKAPTQGSIPVAFLVSDGAVVIDFCGPWEVFQDVSIPGRADAAFQLYTVAETTAPVRASGGLKITPDYSFDTAPAPKVIVIPAQNGDSEATLEWIRRSSRHADVTMSVCTGAFLLARTGLLSGKSATTHHSGYKGLMLQYPDIQVERGARFVDDGNIATAGGLSSGIDLALHVVERYYGRDVAQKTAYQMEYQGQGWLNPHSNEAYAKAQVGTKGHPLCPVCEMEVDPATSPTSVYKGNTYYFCMTSHKELFDAAPAKWL